MHELNDNQPLVPMMPARDGLFSGASPKLTFIMGLVTGVAAVSLVGFILVVLGGQTIGLGAAPTPARAVAQAPTPTNPNSATPPAPSKVSIALRDGDYIRGDKNALVTLVEYSDLECPFCKRFHPEMVQLMQEYQGKVAWVYRHFPLSFHQNAQKEAEATECVGKLGGNEKFWSFVDKIYERTTSNGTGFALTALGPLAKEVGVSQSKFQSCLDSGEFAAKVQADEQQGGSYGVAGTPTTFVNGTPVEGAVDYATLKAAVDQALAAKP